MVIKVVGTASGGIVSQANVPSPTFSSFAICQNCLWSVWFLLPLCRIPYCVNAGDPLGLFPVNISLCWSPSDSVFSGEIGWSFPGMLPSWCRIHHYFWMSLNVIVYLICRKFISLTSRVISLILVCKFQRRYLDEIFLSNVILNSFIPYPTCFLMIQSPWSLN